MGPNALKYILNVARKSLVKDKGSGIMQVPGRMDAEAKASEFVTRLTDAGLGLDKMDDFIRSEADVKKYLNILDSMERERMKVIPADSPQGREITEQLFGKRGEVVDMTGKKIPEGSGIMGGKQIKNESGSLMSVNKEGLAGMEYEIPSGSKTVDDLIQSGDIKKGEVTKKSEKVLERDMFRAANERFSRPKSEVDSIIRNIKKLDPIEAMKEANKLLKREGYYKNMSAADAKRILSETEDHIFERNKTVFGPEDYSPDISKNKKEIIKLENKLGRLNPKAAGFKEKARELVNKIEELKKPKVDEVTKGYIDAVRKGEFEGTEDEFRDLIDKMNDEDFARGGRVGLKDGPPDPSRRNFLKIMGGLAALPIVGKFFKPAKVGKAVTKVPIVKTADVSGKPEWFDSLVNRVILEGDDVTKNFATKEREIVHVKKINDDTSVKVTQDLDEGAIRVEYDSPENMYGDPVQLQYKKPLADENVPNPAAQFDVAESGPVGRQTGPDDYDIDIDEVGGSSIRDLNSDVLALKEYATGKKPTMKEILQKQKRKKKVAEISYGGEAEAEEVVRRQGDFEQFGDINPDPPEFASGGIARMLGE